MSNKLTNRILAFGFLPMIMLSTGFIAGSLLTNNSQKKRQSVPEKVIVHDSVIIRDTVTVFKKEKFPKGAFLVIPADEHEGRKTYSVLIDDKFGMDFMYPEEIALSLIEGKWQYDEMAKVCTYETCADICEEPVLTKKVN
jgi:hypothetical protein